MVGSIKATNPDSNKDAPVDYEEVEHFSDEAGASIWIRFDLDKEEDDD